MTATRAIQLILAGTLSAGAAAVHAGGWGVVTVKDLPEHVTAGRPFDLTFAVRGHGRVLSSRLLAEVEASNGRSSIRAVARPATQEGYYTASLLLREPGAWTLAIRTGYGQGPRLPLKVIETGEQLPPLSPVQRGQQLFAAKGCMTCHRHDAVVSNHPSPVGPPLANGKYQPDYLARLLADPAAAATRPAGSSPWTMPDLELTPKEIDALVSFMTTGTRVAER